MDSRTSSALSLPLKPRLDLATRQIQVQAAKLGATFSKLKERDTYLLNKVVTFAQSQELHQTSMYTNELTETRKITIIVIQAKIALETIALRLNTITELGDIVVTLPSAMSVMRGMRNKLASLLPEAESEIGEIFNLLSNIFVTAALIGGYQINFEAVNEDAEKFIAEASAVAEQTMKKKFPEIPSGLPPVENT